MLSDIIKADNAIRTGKPRTGGKTMNRYLMNIAFAWLLVMPFTSAQAQTTAEEWLKVIDNKLNPPDYEAYRKLINIEPDGTKKEFVMFILKQGREKVISLFLAPATDAGRSILRVGENMWQYIPSIGRPIRITSLLSVTGGVFNNADIMTVDYQEEYIAVSVGVTEEKGTNGTNLLLLTLKAKNNCVAYDKLEMFIDPEKESPVRIRAIASSGILIKTLYFKNIKDFGNGIQRPAVVESDSPLYKGYKSVMIFARIKPRKLSPEVFTLDFMEKLETLR